MVVRGAAQVRFLGGALGAAMLSAVATAQPGVQPPAIQPATTPSTVLHQAVKDMGSEDVVLRMDAQKRLTEGATFRLREVEAVLKEGALGPEQRQRLLTVACRRFCNEPRAALGVQSGMQDMNQRGVMLSMVMPGFPASETLRPGDRILVVDGQTISDISLMRPVVIAHDPGDEVPVVLIRDGATVTLKVKLGRYSDLSRDARGGSQAMTPDMLEGAWEFRSAAYDKANAETKPIESGLSIADWSPNNIVEQDGAADGSDPRYWGAARRRLAEADPKDSECVAAGEARGGGGVVVRLTGQPGTGATFRLAPADGQVLIGPRVPLNDVPGARPMNRQVELAQIRQAQDSLRSAIQRNNAMMRSLPEAQRRSLAQQNAMLQLQIDELERVAVQPAPQLIKP